MQTWESRAELGEEQLENLWGTYIETRDETLRNLLMEYYLPKVKHYCLWYHAKLPKAVSPDEVVSFGVHGLRSAVEKFDPDVGVKFETYCYSKVRGAVLDGLRKLDWMPRHVRVRINHLKKCREELTSALGRKPCDEEIAHYMGLSPDEVHRLANHARRGRRVSLEARVAASGPEDPLTPRDIVVDETAPSPERRIQRESVKQLVLRGLSEAERRLLLLYYYEHLTMREIGAVLGLSESRISQMHSSLIGRLQTTLADRRDEFLE
jgi:RNA polymerase sigma factor for flagellar operon FliA